MIRINLLPVKRKKKAKPLPAGGLLALLIGFMFLAVVGYLFFHFNSVLDDTKTRVAQNKEKIQQLKKTIAEVENFEKLNKTYEDRSKVIEQLRKNQNIPVMLMDEISKHLPNGVWLYALAFSGSNVTIEGFAFSNSEIVSYVDNLKNSRRFADIFLQESKQAEVEKIPVYSFKMSFRVAS